MTITGGLTITGGTTIIGGMTITGGLTIIGGGGVSNPTAHFAYYHRLPGRDEPADYLH